MSLFISTNAVSQSQHQVSIEMLTSRGKVLNLQEHVSKLEIILAMLSVVCLTACLCLLLQMEVDADDKRHRTRSKGICTDTHTHTHTGSTAIQGDLHSPNTNTPMHTQCTHTTAHIPSCHTLVAFSHCSLLLYFSFYMSQESQNPLCSK